jgi:hypothetical protein
MLPAPPLRARLEPPELSPDGSGRIAQLVEQLTLNQRVLGSSPSASTIFFSKYSGLSVSQRSRRIPRRLVLAYF